MFKDYVAEDINTFLNLEEFAESVEINGVSVSIVEDNDELERKIKDEFYRNLEGMVVGDVLFFISKAEYEKIPKVKPIPTADQAIRYKGKPCVITHVSTKNGMYEIILQVIGG